MPFYSDSISFHCFHYNQYHQHYRSVDSALKLTCSVNRPLQSQLVDRRYNINALMWRNISLQQGHFSILAKHVQSLEYKNRGSQLFAYFYSDNFVNFSLLATVSQTYLALIGVVTFINLILLLSILQMSVRFRSVAYVIQEGGSSFM